MRSYLLKSNFKCSQQKDHFVYVYGIIIKCYPNCITCLYFPLVLIRWISCYWHLMELFKSKARFREKVDSNNNWKTMAKNSLSDIIFKIIIRICQKDVEFCGKTSKFLPKRYLFIFCIFYLNKNELNQQICLIKYVENEISNSTSHEKRDRVEQKHNPTSKASFLKLLKNCH